MTVYIVMAIVAYLIGSINFSVIISQRVAGFDVREKGSGNAGSTNVLRSVGKSAAAVTLVCDILKGVIPTILAIIVGNIMGEGVDKALLVQVSSVAVVIRSYISNILPVQRRKRSCNFAWNIANYELANWIDMFSVCFSYNDIN